MTGIPNFAPELIRRVRLPDAMRAKQLAKALSDLGEEGVAQVFRPALGSDWLVGVVGPLQLDVLSSRLDAEYGVPVRFEDAGFSAARWIGSKSEVELKRFLGAQRSALGDRRRRFPGLPRPRPVVVRHAAQGLARDRLRDDAGTGLAVVPHPPLDGEGTEAWSGAAGPSAGRKGCAVGTVAPRPPS